MNYCFFTIILVLSVRITRAQNFLNGSFENNAALTDTVFSSDKLASLVPGTKGISGMIQLVTSDDYCGTAVDGSWFLGGFNNQISEFTMTLDTPLINGSLYQLNMWMRSCLNLGGLVTMKMGVSNNDSTFGSLVEIFSPPDDSWAFQSLVFTAPLTSKYISILFDPVNGGFIQLDGMSLSPATVINQVASTRSVDCFPNPFAAFTAIRLNLTSISKITLEVYSVNGKLMKTLLNHEWLAAGSHEIIFNAEDSAPGVYFYMLRWNENVFQGKMILMP